MESRKSPTPERELLELIEDGKNHNGISPVNRFKRGGALSFAAARARLSFFKNNISNIFHPQEFNIASFNKLLGVIFLFLLFYVSADITSSMLGLKRKVEAAFKLPKKPSFYSQRSTSSLKELKYYLNEAKNRDIFNIVTAKPVKTTKVKDIQAIKEKISYLKLVGISWSDNPDAMIEDTRAKRTLFVKEGDFINDILVKKILKDKVILNLKGEDVELK